MFRRRAFGVEPVRRRWKRCPHACNCGGHEEGALEDCRALTPYRLQHAGDAFPVGACASDARDECSTLAEGCGEPSTRCTGVRVASRGSLSAGE